MNRRSTITTAFFLMAAVFPTRAQNIQVSRENKTVAVTVTKRVEVPSEIGIVQIGFHNEGRAQNSVYEENVRQAQKITETLLSAGVKKSDIQTENVQLNRVVDESSRGQKQEKEPRFEALQTWRVRVPVGEVQKVVDHAVAAGANDVSDVFWAVADPDALDAKARGEAIARARELAEEMTQSLGGKVGGMLHVSNVEPATGYYRASPGDKRKVTQTVEVSAARLPNLNLFPQKVSREVTIYAVFALE